MLFLNRCKNFLKREGLYALLSKLHYHYRYWMFKYKNDANKVIPNSHLESLLKKPLFSIITPCFKSNDPWLIQTIESVQKQTYPHWQLCLGLCEIDSDLKFKIYELSKKDSRIFLVDLPKNMGISENSNQTARIATGDYIGFLDHDDLLSINALREIALTLNCHDYDLIYTDEDKTSENNNNFFLPHIKPDWAPDTFLSHNYFCHFTIMKMSLFKKLGGFKGTFDGAQDYDLFLRATELTYAIGHIPKILYSWRSCIGSTAQSIPDFKPYAVTAGVAAVNRYLQNKNIRAFAQPGNLPGTVRVRYTIAAPLPTVDIIIVTPRVDSLQNCIQSIISKKFTLPFKIHIAIPDNSKNRRAVSKIPWDKKINVTFDNKPFSMSRICNSKGLASSADFLLFINSAVRVTDDSWLENLVEHAQRKAIGAVGTLLYNKQGKIRRSWLTLNPQSIATENYVNCARQSNGVENVLKIIQDVGAVSADCLCTRQKLFKEVGGFELNLPFAFYDVDYCLKLRKTGKRIVYTPYAASLTTQDRNTLNMQIQRKATSAEFNFMRNKWRFDLGNEHFYNSNYVIKCSPTNYDFHAHVRYGKMIFSFFWESLQSTSSKKK